VHFLAGDIGGTKSELAIFSFEKNSLSPVVESVLSSADHNTLEELLKEFLSKNKFKITESCFGVAGPVVDGRAKITNLDWEISEEKLSLTLNSKVRLINDLQATAYYVPFLKKEEFKTLNQGTIEGKNTIGVIAPGTGLGEAFLTWNGHKYVAHASEGGHCNFAPTTQIEHGLLEFMQKKTEHVSYETVCSGPGLFNIFLYFNESGQGKCLMTDEITEAKDPAPLITKSALSKDSKCEICVKTLDTFVSIHGSEASNLALKVFASGGIFVGGGIVPRILPALEDEKLFRTFVNKGRMSDLISRIPLKLIMTPRAALLGAARFGFDSINQS
jgi:glucokinase